MCTRRSHHGNKAAQGLGQEVVAMPVRLNAFANLANLLGSMTVSMGQMLIETPSRRDRITYYEDHF